MVTEEQGGDELRDAALHDEIELVGQLFVAATSTTGHLSQDEIDRLLGVDGVDGVDGVTGVDGVAGVGDADREGGPDT